MRIGIGYDVHPLVADRPMIIGGVTIPYEKGLGGHSDADVLLHAIGDAILGAAALGDLGKHFPDTSDSFANISSLILLKEIAALLHKKRYQVVNIDSTVVLERPKLAPHIAEMKKNIASCLNMRQSEVSVKATTSEKMGFVGKEEGVAAHAVVLIQKIA
ncbi:MAG: 2-C-methyl-D-erythritol 2,4-cyclodiphosphate synthase [Deferribacteres bacterium]|nr:2-C-methyl-D-erythritol 2,4-cyclodiphosphate synthase [candidate division KSB1 bacterium]MCB9510597.1 2-C-methyl-D-erythritol 2,4-cyclodiphosphate synthase [Deferribacteres bacterium]